MARCLAVGKISAKFNFRNAARELIESRFPKIYWGTAMRFYDRLVSHNGGKNWDAHHAYSVLWNSKSYLGFVSSCQKELPRTQIFDTVALAKVAPANSITVKPPKVESIIVAPVTAVAPVNPVAPVIKREIPKVEQITIAPVPGKENDALVFDDTKIETGRKARSAIERYLETCKAKFLKQ